MGQKIKNAVLLTVTKIAALALVISVCCVDSDSYIPTIVLLVSMAWLWLFLKANDGNEEVLFKKWRQ